MSLTRVCCVGAVAVFLAFHAGCSMLAGRVAKGAAKGIERAAGDRAERAATRTVEEAVGEPEAPEAPAAPNTRLRAPGSAAWAQFMTVQAQVAFSYSFSAGGLWLGQTDYQPGEWTRFEMVQQGDEVPVVLERAFLRRLEDSNEWWRVSWSSQGETLVYEALISTSEGRLLRLRARDPEGNEGEVPVVGQAVYAPPMEVTPESIQGATVGKEALSTPAGMFTTDHVIYLAATGEGQIEWWMTDQVPGGVAKYLLRSKQEGVVWTCTLTAKGTDATTVLGSF